MNAATGGHEPFDTLREVERPEVLSIDTQATSVSLRLRLPRRLPWFDGHFPDRPILPGVAQVHLAGVAALSLFGHHHRIIGTGRLKFQRPLLPDAIVTLNLDRTERSLRFEFIHESGAASSGSLRLLGTDESAVL